MFRKWMATGALLWIHGKRTYLSSETSELMDHMFCSWLREEHPVVRRLSNLQHRETYYRLLAPR